MIQLADNTDIAGVSFDKLLGYLTAVEEATGAGISSVSSSFNTMLSRISNLKLSKLQASQNNGEDLSNVEISLRGKGIDLRDSTNQFRDLEEVLDEVSEKWYSFSDASQRSIAAAFAGTSGMNDFLALMENYEKAILYTSVSLDSAGTAMQKFSAYEEGIEGKTERFKNAFQTLSDTMADSDFVGTLVDIGTVGVQAINKLAETISAPVTAAGFLSGLFAYFNKDKSKQRFCPSWA